MGFEFFEETDFVNTELGPLPKDWQVVRLGEVATYLNGYPFKPSDWSKIGKEIIRIQNLTGKSKVINRFEGQLDEIYLVKNGDILISWSGSLGVYKWRGSDAWLNQHIFKVVFNKPISVDPDYFYFCLSWSFTREALKYSHGSIMKHIVKSYFLQIPIPLPPLEEQKAIAEVLRRVQDVIEKTEKVIKATKELKKSLMKHLFTYGNVGLNEIDKVELKETEIGLIPKHWQVVRLGEVADIKQGKQLSAKENIEGKLLKPFLRTSNILWNQIKLEKLSYMYFSQDEVEKFKLNKGDVLICEGGEVGRTAVWEGQIQECFYQNHIHRVRCDGKLYNYFLSYFMECAILIRGLFANEANRTTIPNLSKARLKKFNVPLPPLEEQKEIAQILQAVDKKIQAEKERKKALENLFKSLLHELMSGKIRVKWSEE